MSVLVVGGTGIDTVVPVAGLPVLGADSARPTGPIHDDVSHTGTCLALALHALGVPVAVADAIGAAFLAARLAGAGDEDCLREAVIAGAYACTRPVGADCFIDRAELARRR